MSRKNIIYMKYINKREDFLNKSKHDKIGRLIKEEAGGPFTNDIPWGDSLVGRLINAIVRKSGIAINVNRIQKLIPRLKELFDEILEDSKISQDSQVKVWKLKVFALLQKLKKAVDDEEEINVLVYITDDLITIVNSEFIDDENRKTLLEELKKFKEFLLSLNDETPEEEEEQEEVKPVSVNTQEIPFDFCIKNLKAVYAILIAYKKLKDSNKQQYAAKKDSKGNEIKVGQEYTYNGKKVKVINLEHPQKVGSDKKWLTGDDVPADGVKAPKQDITNPEDGVFVIWPDVPNSVGQALSASKLVPITESADIVSAKPVSILNSVKPVYNLFAAEKDIFADLEQFFKMSPENQKNSKFKNPILKIYNTARKLNEDLNNFLTKPEDIGKSLITMYKSTKLKEDGSFEGIQDDMKLAIGDFNKTMKNILLFQSGVKEVTKKEGEVEKPEEAKPVEAQTKKEDDIDFENKNRSDFNDSVKLLKYSSFMQINELMAGDIHEDERNPQGQSNQAQGTQSQVQGTQSQVQDTQSQELDAKTNADKIKEYFEENVNYKVWMVEESEVKTIETDVENESKDNKELIISSIDPIIEILKLFNRAYKLHTTNNIPGGRTGGAVSRSVYNEYTPFNGTSGQSGISDGPYRNNKIFNVWENAVLDIMKERKYQPIFSKETKIRVGDKLVKGAGATFKRLITDLLDTEKLYNKGAQQKFLNEYFGPDTIKEGTKLGVGDDEKTNGDNSGKIKTIELEFVKNSELTTNEDIKNKKFENKLLQIKSTVDGKAKTIYMFIEGVNGEYFNVSYCNSFYFFNNYIKTQGGELPSLKLEGITISKEVVVNQEVKKFVLRYTKISKNDLSKLLIGSSVQLNSVTEGGETKTDDVKPSLVSWLVNSADKSLYSIKDKDRINSNKRLVGGSTDVNTLLSKKYGDDSKFEPISKIV